MIGNPDYIAVETVMFFGLGFLLAMLMMLAFMPAVHERAVRLTRRKYDPVPLSEKEMHAAKDRLRADFAMSTHKLEQTIEEMQQKVAAHGTDLARKAETITQLKETLDARDAIIAQLQDDAARSAASGQSADGAMAAPKSDNAAKAAALQDANQRIAALMSEVSALTAALDRRIHVYDTQQQEIMALTGQNDALRMQLLALVPPVQRLARGFAPAAEAGKNGKATNPAPQLAPALAPNGEGDVLRRALEAIQAETGNGHFAPNAWISAPSNGAVPFGH